MNSSRVIIDGLCRLAYVAEVNGNAKAAESLMDEAELLWLISMGDRLEADRAVMEAGLD